MTRDYDALAYVDDDGVLFCTQYCDPYGNGDPAADDMTPVFAHDGMDAGTVCDGCDATWDDAGGEWWPAEAMELEVTGLTVLAEVVGDARD